MSLSRIALRIAAVEAIRGKTLVGDHVLDTPNGALDVQADGSLRTDEDRPFIAVYTDQGRATNITGRSLIENGQCDIIFEIGISSAMLERDEDTGADVLVGINVPASDRNREFFLDIVQRQICDALTDPGNAWAEIYRGLHYRIGKIEFVGARTAEDGQRLAGHQMRVTVELADDPLAGEPLDPATPLMRFLAALEAIDDRSYAAQAAIMRGLVSGSIDDRQRLQRRNGMTAAELDALGFETEVLADDGSPATIAAVDIEVDGISIVWGVE